MSDDSHKDPFLDALLDEALAPHDDLPPEILAEMRWMLELLATTHPVSKAIVDRARPREIPDRSGDQPGPAASGGALEDDLQGREGTEG